MTINTKWLLHVLLGHSRAGNYALCANCRSNISSLGLKCSIYWKCTHCAGSGVEPTGCSVCGGDNLIDCPDCGGTGKISTECEHGVTGSHYYCSHFNNTTASTHYYCNHNYNGVEHE